MTNLEKLYEKVKKEIEESEDKLDSSRVTIEIWSKKNRRPYRREMSYEYAIRREEN